MKPNARSMLRRACGSLTSALLLLLEDTYSEGVINGMTAYDTNVVTLTVGDDLSGEIAQYAAASSSGAATDASSSS